MNKKNNQKLINRILLLGPSDGLKSKIILELIKDLRLFENREIIFVCEDISGKARQYCQDNKIKYIAIADPKFKTSESIQAMKDTQADILVSCGWSYIIPDSILGMFKFPPVNCHSSLLPDYRGMRAYNNCWANMEEEYGATIHYMTSKLDDGNIITKGKLKMFKEETLQILHRRICEVTAYMLPNAISLVEDGFEGYKQEGTARYFDAITMDEAKEYRKENEYRISKKLDKKITKHKSWSV